MNKMPHLKRRKKNSTKTPSTDPDPTPAEPTATPAEPAPTPADPVDPPPEEEVGEGMSQPEGKYYFSLCWAGKITFFAYIWLHYCENIYSVE